MKKILVISYYFPPANFAGSHRPAAWAKFLHESGYYPLVITRQWNENQTDLSEPQEHKELSVERSETHEIHRLPYNRTWRDKCTDYKWLKFIQKSLTLLELILSKYFIRALPYSNFYEYSQQLIREHGITTVIITGGPFQSFFIGYQLKKDFPSIHWVPDYRDEWNTRTKDRSASLILRIVCKLNQKSELKWTSNASFFLSVSSDCVQSIGKYISKEGFAVLNGFNEIDNKEDLNKQHSIELEGDFKLLYLGTLYDNQNFSNILEAIKRINQGSKLKVKLNFLGSYSNDQDYKTLLKRVKNCSEYVKILPKVRHHYVWSLLEKCDLCVLTPYKGILGCLPVKIFEYYQAQKPILLSPSDNGLMETFVLQNHCGTIANSIEECEQYILELIKLKNEGKTIYSDRKMSRNLFYSRKYQTKRLAEILDKRC